MNKNIIFESQEYTPRSLMESMDLAKNMVDTIFRIIIYYIFDTNSNIFSLTNILGLISGLGSIVLNRLAIKYKSKIKTLIRIQGFIIGAITGGVITLKLLERDFREFKLSKELARVAVIFIYNRIRANTKFLSKADKVARKISRHLFKLPEYNDFLEDIVINQSEVKLSAKSYIYSAITGLLAGSLVGYLFFKNKSKIDMSLNNIIESFSSRKDISLVVGASLSAMTSNSISNIVSTPALVKHDIVMTKFKNIIIGIFKPNIKNDKFNLKINRRKFNSKFIDSALQKIKSSDVRYIIQKVTQSIILLSTVDKNFNKFIDIIEFQQALHDNACVSRVKNKKNKFKICIMLKQNNSFWDKLTVDEIVAVLLHELGHAVTGVFNIIPLAEASYYLMNFIGAVTHPFVRQLNIFASLYSLSTILRISELQADAYAIKKGYGDHLYNALKIIVPYYKWIEEEVEVNVHGNLKIRINSIRKASETFKKISKGIENKNK